MAKSSFMASVAEPKLCTFLPSFLSSNWVSFKIDLQYGLVVFKLVQFQTWHLAFFERSGLNRKVKKKDHINYAKVWIWIFWWHIFLGKMYLGRKFEKWEYLPWIVQCHNTKWPEWIPIYWNANISKAFTSSSQPYTTSCSPASFQRADLWPAEESLLLSVKMSRLTRNNAVSSLNLVNKEQVQKLKPSLRETSRLDNII